jgi:hypothetical protein
MSAGGKAAQLGMRPMSLRSLDWQGGALIRCIVVFALFGTLQALNDAGDKSVKCSRIVWMLDNRN